MRIENPAGHDPLSTFLYHGLVERGVAVECICARHAKGVLSARVNKSDVHDAEGLAQLARTGWYKRVHMKASATHIDRAALRIRAQLITARTSMANQLRGLLKLFGLRMGTARTPGPRAERLSAFYAQRPDLKALFAPLIASMEAIEEQLRAYNRLLNDRAKADEICARLMSVPGVGPITALTYTSTIEDPRRFARSDDVGAYAGLVPRRSLGKPACTGRIQFNAGKICQRLLQLTVIRASGFIGDPLDLPLAKPADQFFVPLGRICELSLTACGMGKHIKGCFGDVDADRFW
ncbi:MAG: transposase [Sphingomonadales bacterium]|nr:transposase [Sphingomonadales bacterium]MDE2172018.1 transposase [Sphingomonadales bacterium]